MKRSFSSISKYCRQINDAFREVDEHIKFAETKTIAKHSSSSFSFDEYKIPVASYILLSHAAIEEFLEIMFLYAYYSHCGIYLQYNCISNVLLALIKDNTQQQIGKEREERQKSIFHNICTFAHEALVKVEESIASNHGIREHNINELLYVFNVDKPSQFSPSTHSSWNDLTEFRGIFAHKHSGLSSSKFLSPEDAKVKVTDCLNYCEHVKDSIIKDIYFWNSIGIMILNTMRTRLLATLTQVSEL